MISSVKNGFSPGDGKGHRDPHPRKLVSPGESEWREFQGWIGKRELGEVEGEQRPGIPEAGPVIGKTGGGLGASIEIDLPEDLFFPKVEARHLTRNARALSSAFAITPCMLTLSTSGRNSFMISSLAEKMHLPYLAGKAMKGTK